MGIYRRILGRYLRLAMTIKMYIFFIIYQEVFHVFFYQKIDGSCISPWYWIFRSNAADQMSGKTKTKPDSHLTMKEHRTNNYTLAPAKTRLTKRSQLEKMNLAPQTSCPVMGELLTNLSMGITKVNEYIFVAPCARQLLRKTRKHTLKSWREWGKGLRRSQQKQR